MLITRKSWLSGEVRTLDLPITESELFAYQCEGVLLQNAFPHLTAGQREFIKSGITDEEWDEHFGMEPEEEEVQ
jgi:hypothetical protein